MKMKLLCLTPVLVITFLVISSISIRLVAVNEDDKDFKLFNGNETVKLVGRGGGGGHGGGHGGGSRSFSGGRGGSRSFSGSRGGSRSFSGSRSGGHGASKMRSGSKGSSRVGRGGSKSRGGSHVKSGHGGGRGGSHAKSGHHGGRGRHGGGHGGRGGHHGHHGGHYGRHHGHWGDRGWRNSYWGFGWGAPWWPGLFWYPGIAAWYWGPYNCLVTPMFGIGYGLAFAGLAYGYYWYPSINVSVYVAEKEDVPSGVVYVENEDDDNPVYYAVYRKVLSGDDSYLIKVSSPQILSTKKTVKVYLPETSTKNYVVVTRRSEEEFKDNMDEKGNEVDDDIVKQIRKEKADLIETKNIKADENIDEEEVGKLKETKESARKDESKLREGLAKIEVNKDKLPTEEELAKKNGKPTKYTKQSAVEVE
ncbi:MAG: hypothetical protein US49_C0001G0089 [candidate division TM6 bacterium GW2011_GWF2_37_49]|nr:MAG: hypothetical protein US49_C0001G0089 [candidate division TM6 bacterium GW2011_GWF2_37_49]